MGQFIPNQGHRLVVRPPPTCKQRNIECTRWSTLCTAGLQPTGQMTRRRVRLVKAVFNLMPLHALTPRSFDSSLNWSVGISNSAPRYVPNMPAFALWCPIQAECQIKSVFRIFSGSKVIQLHSSTIHFLISHSGAKNLRVPSTPQYRPERKKFSSTCGREWILNKVFTTKPIIRF